MNPPARKRLRTESKTTTEPYDDYNKLAENEEDSLALSKLSEYEREAELARRHERAVRDRQREELLSSTSLKPNTQSSTQKPLALVPARASIECDDQGSDLDISDEEEEEKPLLETQHRKTGEEARQRGLDSRMESDPLMTTQGFTGKAETISSIVTLTQRDVEEGPTSSTSTTTKTATAAVQSEEGSVRKDMGALFRLEEQQDFGGIGETKRLGKRLEKALALLTPSLLESVRLSQRKVKEMQEHPQVASYLHGSLVKMSNVHRSPLPLYGASQGDSSRSSHPEPPSTVAARILSLDHCANTSSSRDEFLFDLDVLPLSGGSKVRIQVSDIVDEPFSENDVFEVQAFLRDRKETHEFAESFPHAAKRKAQELRDFTFTENDVVEILERKRQQQQTHGPVSYQACYQRRTDVELKVEQLKNRLQSSSLSRDDRKAIISNLKSLEVELYSLNRQVDSFKSGRSDCKDGGTMPHKAVSLTSSLHHPTVMNSLSTKSKAATPVGGSGLFIYGGGGGRGFLKDVVAPTTTSLFDRSLSSSLTMDGLATPAPPFVSRIPQSQQRPTASSAGPEVTLRLLANVEAMSRDAAGKQHLATATRSHLSQQKPSTSPSSIPLQPTLSSLMAELSINQQTGILKAMIATHQQYWHNHVISTPPFTRSPNPKFPLLLRKKTCSAE